MMMKEWMEDVDRQIGALTRAATVLASIRPDMGEEEARAFIEYADDALDDVNLRELSQRIANTAAWEDGRC